MPVLERSELEASPLADLHAIADQVGIDGFKRLRKAELIDAILGAENRAGGAPAADADADADADGSGEEEAERPARRRRRLIRTRRGSRRDAEEESAAEEQAPAGEDSPAETAAPEAESESEAADEQPPEKEEEEAAERAQDERPPRGGGRRASSERRGRGSGSGSGGGERTAEGVVEVLANGSAFVRVNPPEHSADDLYISSAQVRRCELVSGDSVSGPVRTPRRSERYPSLVRIDTINGSPADEVTGAMRYDDMAADWPSERLALGSSDPTLEAIEWLTPLGRGSRAVIVGGRFAGKTEVLRRLAETLARQDDIAVSAVLVGVRPEEITQWQEGPVAPAAALAFAASADAQGQALERVLETAKRTAARGGHALVLIDCLDGVHPHTARKALAAARRLRDGGTLTVIATATRPFGGETTVIALDAQATLAGRQPILDLTGSGTLRPELLVGEDGAAAITRARAAAFETAG
jgi:transcription termination factor Rho